MLKNIENFLPSDYQPLTAELFFEAKPHRRARARSGCKKAPRAPHFGFRLSKQPKATAGRCRAARLPPRHRTAPRRALRCAEPGRRLRGRRLRGRGGATAAQRGRRGGNATEPLLAAPSGGRVCGGGLVDDVEVGVGAEDFGDDDAVGGLVVFEEGGHDAGEGEG